MKSSKRIAIIVDNPRRDLPGLLLLAAELARNGALCYLVPMNLAKNELSALMPDFVLLNYLRRINAPLARGLLEAAIQVGVLDTEGGVMSDFEHYAVTIPEDQETRRAVAAFYTWGQDIAAYLKSAGWYRDEQLVVTGNPRFDFYKDPWKQVPLARMSDIHKRYSRPIVLIAGNFSLCNPLSGNLKREIDIWVQAGHDRETVLEWQRLNRETLDGMVSLVHYLAEHFPQYTFVYRPHPFENADMYTNVFDSRANIHVDSSGTVDGWLLQCDAVIQRNSSTGIEAGFAGIPSLVPEWIPVAFPIPSVEAVSFRCYSQEQLAETLEGLVQGGVMIPTAIEDNIEHIINRWFFRVDGCAHKRIAEDILRRSSINQDKIRIQKCRDIHYTSMGNSFKMRVAMKIRKTLQMPLGRRFWDLRIRKKVPVLPWDNTAKCFGVGEVREQMGAISAVLETELEGKATSFGVRLADSEDYRLNLLTGRSIAVYRQ